MSTYSTTPTTTTTMADLPSSTGHYRKLPPELNCQIFCCLNLPTRRKFIWGLGWDFYTMFRQKLLRKIKRVCNPNRNRLKGTTKGAIVKRNSLRGKNIFANKGFTISGKRSQADNFPGTFIYYYEVKLLSESKCMVGLSDGTTKGKLIGEYPNSYAVRTIICCCRLAGETHYFELVDGTIQSPAPKLNGTDVYGCGLVIDPNDKLAIFFTLNGILIGRQTPISPSVDRLIPAVSIWENLGTVEANFGNDKNKPFEYDIKNCPGMGLDCF